MNILYGFAALLIGVANPAGLILVFCSFAAGVELGKRIEGGSVRAILNACTLLLVLVPITTFIAASLAAEALTQARLVIALYLTFLATPLATGWLLGWLIGKPKRVYGTHE